MGVYDTIWVKCPKCGTKNGFQTKSGECCLYSYDLENAPADALYDVNRHAPAECSSCKTLYYVEFDITNRRAVIHDETTDI